MPRYLLALALIAFAVYCFADVMGADENRRGGIPRVVWGLIALLTPVGPAIWLLFSRNRPATSTNTNPARYSRREKSGFRGATAPDDDPDFLWKLAAEQRRKREAEERKKDASPEQSGDSSQSEGQPDDHSGDGPSSK